MLMSDTTFWVLLLLAYNKQTGYQDEPCHLDCTNGSCRPMVETRYETSKTATPNRNARNSLRLFAYTGSTGSV